MIFAQTDLCTKSNIVIPTEADASQGEATAEWRDLLLIGSPEKFLQRPSCQREMSLASHPARLLQISL
jgi:hypothetical protein